MKVTEDVLGLTTTQSELARVLGVSQPYVSKLIKQGVILRDGHDTNGGVYLVSSLKNFWQKDAQNTDDEEVDVYHERALREAAERKLAELKLARQEGRVYEARTVEMVQTEMLSNLRTQLLGIPSKVAGQIPENVRSQVNDILTREIEEKLGELSEYTPEQYLSEEVPDRGENGG